MEDDTTRVVSASCTIAANAADIFELIADAALQPLWDGNDNIAVAEPGQRVRHVGDVFTTKLTKGVFRTNHVVEFVEGQRIAWLPSEPDLPPFGQLWRWELTPLTEHTTLVTHTYDWTQLTDPTRVERARWTTAERLNASLVRLAALAESGEAHQNRVAT